MLNTVTMTMFSCEKSFLRHVCRDREHTTSTTTPRICFIAKYMCDPSVCARSRFVNTVAHYTIEHMNNTGAHAPPTSSTSSCILTQSIVHTQHSYYRMCTIPVYIPAYVIFYILLILITCSLVQLN